MFLNCMCVKSSGSVIVSTVSSLSLSPFISGESDPDVLRDCMLSDTDESLSADAFSSSDRLSTYASFRVFMYSLCSFVTLLGLANLSCRTPGTYVFPLPHFGGAGSSVSSCHNTRFLLAANIKQQLLYIQWLIY